MADPAPYQKVAKDQIRCLKEQAEDLLPIRKKRVRDRMANIFLIGMFGVWSVLAPILFVLFASEFGMDTGAPFMLLMGAISVGFVIYGVHGFKKENAALKELDKKMERLDATLATDPARKRT